MTNELILIVAMHDAKWFLSKEGYPQLCVPVATEKVNEEYIYCTIAPKELIEKARNLEE